MKTETQKEKTIRENLSLGVYININGVEDEEQ